MCVNICEGESAGELQSYCCFYFFILNSSTWTLWQLMIGGQGNSSQLLHGVKIPQHRCKLNYQHTVFNLSLVLLSLRAYFRSKYLLETMWISSKYEWKHTITMSKLPEQKSRKDETSAVHAGLCSKTPWKRNWKHQDCCMLLFYWPYKSRWDHVLK